MKGRFSRYPFRAEDGRDGEGAVTARPVCAILQLIETLRLPTCVHERGLPPLAIDFRRYAAIPTGVANAMHGLQCQFPFPSRLLLSAWRIVRRRRFARGRVSPRRESAFFRSQSLQQFPSLVDTLHHAFQLREFAGLGLSFLAGENGTGPILTRWEVFDNLWACLVPQESLRAEWCFMFSTGVLRACRCSRRREITRRSSGC